MNKQIIFKIQDNHILGKLDTINSLKQSIAHILFTERGFQFTITQALLTDDRIQDSNSLILGFFIFHLIDNFLVI